MPHLHDEGAHYSAQTYHQLVADVAIEPDAADDYDMACLNTVDSDQSTRWNCTICINGYKVLFKVDTGVEVTTIAEDHSGPACTD